MSKPSSTPPVWKAIGYFLFMVLLAYFVVTVSVGLVSGNDRLMAEAIKSGVIIVLVVITRMVKR